MVRLFLRNLPAILAFDLSVVALVAGLHFLAPFLPFYLLVPGSMVFAVFVFLQALYVFSWLGIRILKFLMQRFLSW